MHEPIRVISLDRTPQRFAQFLADNAGFAVQRFAACDGGLLTPAGCVAEGLISAENIYNAGALGTARSHVTLWRECVASGAPMVVAEDDIVLRADFWPAMAALLERVPGWDIVLWTHNFDWPVKVAPAPGTGEAVIQYTAPGSELDVQTYRAATTPSFLLPLRSAAGIGCYSISPAGAARLLARCLPIGAAFAEYATKPGLGWENNGIDVEMSRHYTGMAAYIAMPPLALAPNDQAASTIRGHLAALHDVSVPD